MGDDPLRSRTAIGELIYAYRSRRGWSQEELASHIQLLASKEGRRAAAFDRETMHPNSIGNWERRLQPGEKARIPQITMLKRVAEVFGLRPDSDEYRDLFAARLASSRGQRVDDSGSAKQSGSIPTFVTAGRETHLARLEHLAAQARRGNPAVAMVHAEPGAGKSTLIGEFSTRIAKSSDGRIPAIVSAACRDDHQGDGLRPARVILAALLDDGENLMPIECPLPPVGARSGLEAFIAASLADAFTLPAWPLPSGTLDRLSEHPAIDSEIRGRIVAARQAMRNQIPPTEAEHGAAWVDALVTRARGIPGGLFVIVEDIHWASTSFAETLIRLVTRMEREPDLPLLLVLSWRPTDLPVLSYGALDGRNQLVHEAKRGFPDGDIDLQTSIGGVAGRRFVEQMLHQGAEGVVLSPAFVSALAARTDGLPFFVIGLIRHFRERGIIGTGDAVGVRDIDWTTIPLEMEPLFKGRIERLDPLIRDLLAMASVQGEQFVAEIAIQATEVERDLGFETLDRELRQRHDLVRYVGEYGEGAMREHVWTFSHALLRDYVQAAMTPFERRIAHLRTANAFLDVHGEEANPRSERIAWHLERGDDLTRAATHWVRAGDQAVTEGEVIQAARHFAHVEGLGAAIANPAMLVQSYFGRSNCARMLGDGDAALRFAERGVDRARRMDDRQLLTNALQMVSTIRFDRGQSVEGLDGLREARDLLEHLDNPVERCRVEYLLAINLIAIGHFDEATVHADLALERARLVGTDRVGITAQVVRANIDVELGRYAEALERYHQATKQAQHDRHRTSEALCWVNIGLAYAELGEPGLATEALARVHEIGRDVPVMGFVAAAWFDAGLIAESLGEAEDAERAFARSLTLRREIGQSALEVDSMASLLRVAVMQDDRMKAVALLDEIEVRVARDGMIGTEHLARLFVALLLGNAMAARWETWQVHAGAAERSLRERVEHIADPELRRSFLEHVPAHRQLRGILRNDQSRGRDIGGEHDDGDVSMT